MIGIIGAMDEEVAILKESMEVQDTMERAGMTFVKGIMSGKEVVVVRSGIGKVNMGICAQILIDCFGVDTLINTGVAGSLDADINIGDIVISTDAVQHDMDVSMLGDPVGQIPRMDTFSFPAEAGSGSKQRSESGHSDIYRKSAQRRSVYFRQGKEGISGKDI